MLATSCFPLPVQLYINVHFLPIFFSAGGVNAWAGVLFWIYNAVVRPYFDYCCEVWEVFDESQSKRLQKNCKIGS